MASDSDEAGSLVERDGAVVALPDTEPENVGVPAPGLSDTRLHQPVPDPGTVRGPIDVDPLQLDGLGRSDPVGANTTTHQREADVDAVDACEPRDPIGVEKLLRLPLVRERPLEMDPDVLSRVVGRERLREEPRAKTGETIRIGTDRAPNSDSRPSRPERICHRGSLPLSMPEA